MSAAITAKCVGCGHEQEVPEGHDPTELPSCEKCMAPMYAKEASSK